MPKSVPEILPPQSIRPSLHFRKRQHESILARTASSNPTAATPRNWRNGKPTKMTHPKKLTVGQLTLLYSVTPRSIT